MKDKQRWVVVVIFAIAMAWVESAVVVYLRMLINRIDPYQANPLPIVGGLAPIELGREIATLVMLLAVGWLAGTAWRMRLAYAAMAFGVWDISYYVFLAPMSGWPSSLFDWDILFLLPLPWWGPVLAPVSIAALMSVGGTIITQLHILPRRWAWTASLAGAALALYVFMADAIRVAANGERAIRNVLPTDFDWTRFCIAFVLLAAPVADMGWRLVTRHIQPDASPRLVGLGMTEAKR